LTITRLPLGALNITATEGADTVFLRSDEPGWLVVEVAGGDLVIDGEIAPNPVAFAMPKGPITIEMLGGDDQLVLKPMIIPGSLTINDPSGEASTFIEGLIVKGALTYNGSTGDDAINIEGRLSVGKDFKVELGSGASDLIYNYNRGLSLNVVGSFRVHGTADATTIALGLAPNGDRVRPNDDPATLDVREPDMPLLLREMRIGRDFVYEGGEGNAIYLSAANTLIGGKFTAKGTGPDAYLDYFQKNDGPLRIGTGLQIEAGLGTSVLLEGLNVTVGGAINVVGGTAADYFTAFSNTTMKLPKTTLNLGAGASITEMSATEAWSLAGNLSITAAAGDDNLALRGPGKVTGSVIGQFGDGVAEVLVNGGTFGRMSVGPLFKIDALEQVLVGIYNSTMNGRVEVIGHGGDDVLAFDSVKVVGAVVFTGSGGLDAFLIDNTDIGYFAASSFLGPVTADMGESPDTVVIGRELLSGRVTFSVSVNIRGIVGEAYMVASPPFATFKKTPVVS